MLSNLEKITTIKVKISPIDGMRMVYVPAGEFIMGSNDVDNEQPLRSIYLDAYWIDQTPVTCAMFAKFMNKKGREEKDWLDWWTQVPISEMHISLSNETDLWYVIEGYEDHPMVHINWFVAQSYCRWAGRELPTEAQWEKAARGTDGRKYPWGDEEPDFRAANNLLNFNEQKGDTSAVGSYPDGASPYGAVDMVGNVFEWTADSYEENFYKTMPIKNPRNDSTKTFCKTIRGVGWTGCDDLMIRPTFRYGESQTRNLCDLGFRCVSAS